MQAVQQNFQELATNRKEMEQTWNFFAQHMATQNSKADWLYTQMQGFNKTLQDVAQEFLGMKTFLQQISSGIDTHVGVMRGEVVGFEGRLTGRVEKLEQVHEAFLMSERGRDQRIIHDFTSLEARIAQMEKNVSELSNKTLLNDGLLHGESQNLGQVLQHVNAIEAKQITMADALGALEKHLVEEAQERQKLGHYYQTFYQEFYESTQRVLGNINEMRSSIVAVEQARASPPHEFAPEGGLTPTFASLSHPPPKLSMDVSPIFADSST